MGFLADMMGEYLWVIGLSVFVVGATKLFNNPIGLLISGAVVFLIGVGVKAATYKEPKK